MNQEKIKKHLNRFIMKNLRIFLIMIIFCNCFGYSTNIIKVQTATTTSGNTGKFYIIMKNDVSINGLNFTLRYDPFLITPIKFIPVGNGEYLSGSAATLYNDNKINFILYDQGFNFLFPDSGYIFEVEYIVRGSITDSTITYLTFTEATVADSNISYVSFEFINGKIFISPTVGFENMTNLVPDRYELYQNYPNPFNPITLIRYALPKESFVTLKVYNVLGQEISIIVNEEKNAGKYEVNFDGSNFASGVYFYQMRTKEFIKTLKFLLIK